MFAEDKSLLEHQLLGYDVHAQPHDVKPESWVGVALDADNLAPTGMTSTHSSGVGTSTESSNRLERFTRVLRDLYFL